MELSCSCSSGCFGFCLSRGFIRLFQRFTFAMDDNLDFGDQVHGQANMSGELSKIADRLHVNLLLLDFVARLFLNGSCHILRGDGTIELPCFPSLGGKDYGDAVDMGGEVFEFGVLFRAADFSGGTNFLSLLERACCSEHCQSLRDEKVASIAIGDFFDVASAPQFVNVLDK